VEDASCGILPTSARILPDKITVKGSALVKHHQMRSPRALRAWPPAWPLPSGPPGRQRLRRSRAGPEDPFCEAVRKDLRVPLTLEGPPLTMRGVPARHCDHSPGDRHIRRDQDGPAQSARARSSWARCGGDWPPAGAGAANRRQRRGRWAPACRARHAAARSRRVPCYPPQASASSPLTPGRDSPR